MPRVISYAATSNTTFTYAVADYECSAATIGSWAATAAANQVYQDEMVDEMVADYAEYRAAREAELLVAAAEADKRAEALLLVNLTAEQAEDYRRTKSFEVIQPLQFGRPVRRYRITFKFAGNVFLVDEQGRAVAQYCIHAREPIPIADNMLAQKLMLEADEEQFLRVANRTVLRAA